MSGINQKSNRLNSYFAILAILFIFPSLVNSQEKVTPFRLPTYNDVVDDFKASIPPLKRVPQIDEDFLYQSVLDCFPAPSKFDRFSLKLESGASLSTGDYDSFDSPSGIGRHYIQIVASMPLIDAVENDRERERERMRRQTVAKLVSQFVQALSSRNRAIRSLGLFTALEKRSQVRVNSGVIGAEEQIGYLEKVIAWQEQLSIAKAKMTETRLALVGQCRTGERIKIETYMNGFIEQ